MKPARRSRQAEAQRAGAHHHSSPRAPVTGTATSPRAIRAPDTLIAGDEFGWSSVLMDRGQALPDANVGKRRSVGVRRPGTASDVRERYGVRLQVDAAPARVVSASSRINRRWTAR